MLTNLHLGARVTGFNDESLGTVKSLVADPNTNLITHLVVQEDTLGARQILVESGRLNRVSEDGREVNLNLDRAQLTNLPDFMERQIVGSEVSGNPNQPDYGDNPVPAEAQILPGQMPPMGSPVTVNNFDPVSATVGAGGAPLIGTSNGVFGNAIGPVGAPVEERLNVPENSLIIREGANVEALDGHIGKVKEVNIDPDSGQITSFVVEKGLFILDDYTVPIEMVDTANQDEVYLKLTKNDFKNAPMAADRIDNASDTPADNV